MVIAPFQVGYFIDFHPLLGPAALTIGVNFLLLWFVEKHLIAKYFLRNNIPPGQHMVISIPLILGLFLTTTAYTIKVEAVWTVAFILLLCGKVMEGAIFIRRLNRLLYHLNIGTEGIRGRSTRSSKTRALYGKIVKKATYHLLTAAVILIAATSAISVSFLIFNSLIDQIAFLWAIIIGTTTIQRILWDIRSILFIPQRNNLNLIALFGMLFNIVGAEVYNYADYSIQINRTLPVFQRIPIPISTIEIAIFTFGQGALIIGAIFAVAVVLRNK